MDAESLTTALLALDPALKKREKADRPSVEVPPGMLPLIMRKLRADPALAFDTLLDHTAIDWIEGNRFELTWQFFSLEHGHYAMISASVPRDNPVLPTVCGIWPVAQWQEREVYDLFGVLYEGHPDLRRLFLEDDWAGFPLRKDYKDDHLLVKPE